MTVLIACAHGTRDPQGQEVIRELIDQVRDALGVEVREAYVDVQDPHVAEVVSTVQCGIMPGVGPAAAVVVPLLLAGGYHVHVDIARAVEHREDVAATPALGPDARLIDMVVDRLREAGVPLDTAVVFAAAGSSDPRSQADTEAAAALLRERWLGPVEVGYAAGIAPTAADAVGRLRDQGHASVAVASYLLAPGFFQRRLEEAEADWVTAPLAPDARLVEIIAERYRSTSGL